MKISILGKRRITGHRADCIFLNIKDFVFQLGIWRWLIGTKN